MDVFDAIYTRRSIRKFLDTPVEFDKLVEVIKAGSYAPCAGDLQNWRFILETNRDRIRSMYHHTLEQEAFTTATAAILVVAELDAAEKFYGLRGKRLYSVQNCAAAVQNILLAAHAQGLGAVWIGAFDENRINDEYKIPSVARTQAIILLGYPDEVPKERHVKNVWFLTNFHRWGLKYEHPHRVTHTFADEWTHQRQVLKQEVSSFGQKLQRKLNRNGSEETTTGDGARGTGDTADGTRGVSGERKGGVKGMSSAAADAGKEYFLQARATAKTFLDNLKKEEYRGRAATKRLSTAKGRVPTTSEKKSVRGQKRA